MEKKNENLPPKKTRGGLFAHRPAIGRDRSKRDDVILRSVGKDFTLGEEIDTDYHRRSSTRRKWPKEPRCRKRGMRNEKKMASTQVKRSNLPSSREKNYKASVDGG